MATGKVVERLTSYLDGGDFPSQTRLPAERRLAEELNVSRANLRHALAILEAQGKIWRHIGKGTFVGERPVNPPQTLLPLMETTNPTEVMELRLAIEPSIAGLAALRATAGDIAQLERCLEKGHSTQSFEVYELWDATLHRSIAEAAHNGALLAVINAVNSLREDRLWGRLKQASFTPRRQYHYSEQHVECVEAIKSRDAAEAERLMRVHLETVQANMFNRREPA